jgi:ABC-type multidrug transport system fused ATPase/permease subunit
VLKVLRLSFAFMTGFEKSVWIAIVSLRSALALLDIAAIMAIGYLATSTVALISGGSDAGPSFELLGLKVPAVSINTIPLIAALILALFLVKAVLSIALTRWAAFFVAQIEARAAKTISEIRFGGNLIGVRKYSLEEMMYAVQGGTANAFYGLLNSFNTLVSEGFLFIVVIAIGFFFVDAIATVAAILYFGLVAFIIQFFIGSLMSRAQEVNYDSSIRVASSVNNLISVFRELSVSGKLGKYIDDIYIAKKEFANSNAKTFYLGGMPRYIIEAALLVGLALFFLSQLLAGDISSSAGKVGIFIAGGFRLTAALLPLQSALLSIKAAIPGAKIAHDILLGAPELLKAAIVPADASEQHIIVGKPIGVVFDDVSFSYPDSPSPAITNVNFTVEPGSQTALMGASGAGKSTIADILCLLLAPTSGRVYRSTNLSEKLGEIGGRVSYVPQKPGMVSGTILENVALGEEVETVDREEVIAALQAAHLGNLILDLPQGIDTPLGKLKDSLSGGQMQRLGLARAIYSRPSLLVMDEATSALDAESEAEIQKTLEEMRGQVTVVVIAHRLNTIQHADKVILLQDGKVQDSGTFKELIARNPSVEKGVELMRIEEN